MAQTGTGKTIAYLLPLLRQWSYQKKKSPYTIVVVPTRELVVQVCEQLEALAKYTSIVGVGAHGGGNIKAQASAIVMGADVVVGTPTRLKDLILNGSIPAKGIKKIVIDEVDQLLSLGFRQELHLLMDLLPAKRQNLYFSATVSAEVEALIASQGYAVELIRTEDADLKVARIEHRVVPVPNFTTKLRLLQHLLATEKTMNKVLVFAGTKKHADRIFQVLASYFPEQIAVVHGNKNSNHRLRTVDEFEAGLCRVLVASDVLARGIDVSNVTHVVNFTIPSVPEDFIHRVGRTGRAERNGVAYSFVTPTEMDAMAEIEAKLGEELPLQELPSEVEISSQLLPEEEQRPGMKIVQARAPHDPLKGAAFHEKLEKNKKIPVKVSRADKMKLKYGKNYQSGHGGGTR